jgi:hypothetical protein
MSTHWSNDEEMGNCEDTLGPCGCVDYHMADCPLRTDSISLGLDNDHHL